MCPQNDRINEKIPPLVCGAVPARAIPPPKGLIAFSSQGERQESCSKDYQHSGIDEIQNPDMELTMQARILCSLSGDLQSFNEIFFFFTSKGDQLRATLRNGG